MILLVFQSGKSIYGVHRRFRILLCKKNTLSDSPPAAQQRRTRPSPVMGRGRALSGKLPLPGGTAAGSGAPRPPRNAPWELEFLHPPLFSRPPRRLRGGSSGAPRCGSGGARAVRKGMGGRRLPGNGECLSVHLCLYPSAWNRPPRPRRSGGQDGGGG